jgi:hypothetical protein
MSWTGYEENQELETAITAASNANILMFCSTADDNRSGDSIWKNDKRVFKVAASDVYGNWRPQSDRAADILLPGDKMAALGPKYLRSNPESKISGSSVATALATGLASLVLSCAAEDKELGPAYFRKKKTMEKVFNEMKKREGHNYLLPSKMLDAMNHARVGRR